MYETYVQLANRKQIPLDIAARPAEPILDVIEAVGAYLRRPAWATVLRRLPRGAVVRVLLLDPDLCGGPGTAGLGVDPREMRSRIAGVTAGLRQVGHDNGLVVSVRYYRRPPVTRYVRSGDSVYESVFPASPESPSVPVARHPANGLLGRRARREFDVLWHHGSRPAPPDEARPMAGSALDEPPGPTIPAVTSGPRTIELVAHRKAIAAHVEAQGNGVRALDFLDVAAAAQVLDDWQRLLTAHAPVRIRAALLDPAGWAVHVRARESTRWRGDVDGLRSKIVRNTRRLRQQAADAGNDLTVRYYDLPPVSRYVWSGHRTTYVSVYPSDESSKDTKIAVLPETDVLAMRARTEFETTWQHLSRDAGDC